MSEYIFIARKPRTGSPTPNAVTDDFCKLVATIAQARAFKSMSNGVSLQREAPSTARADRAPGGIRIVMSGRRT